MPSKKRSRPQAPRAFIENLEQRRLLSGSPTDVSQGIMWLPSMPGGCVGVDVCIPPGGESPAPAEPDGEAPAPEIPPEIPDGELPPDDELPPEIPSGEPPDAPADGEAGADDIDDVDDLDDVVDEIVV